MENRVEILFCTQCRWLLRAAWMAQELLTILDQEIPEFSLKLGRGGIFEIRANGALVWSRKEQGDDGHKSPAPDFRCGSKEAVFGSQDDRRGGMLISVSLHPGM